MAVTKLWSVTERLGQVIDYATNPEKTSANIKREFSPEQYQALADVIAYAKDEEKTEREFYVEGINCNVAIARDQFITVKEQFKYPERFSKEVGGNIVAEPFKPKSKDYER